MLLRAKALVRSSILKVRFSTAPPPAPKKIEMFINDEPYQVSCLTLRWSHISPFSKLLKKTGFRFRDSVTTKD